MGYYDPVKVKQHDIVEFGIPITGWYACVSYEQKYRTSHEPVRMAVTELLKEFIRTEGDAECKALGSIRLMEATTAEAPKNQPSASTQPFASIQPEPPAPSRKGKQNEVLPSIPTASDSQSASIQGESTRSGQKGKKKRKGKKKGKGKMEVLPSMDEVDEMEQSEGSGQSDKEKEKEDLPSTSAASDLPSTSIHGESTQSGQEGNKKRKGKKKGKGKKEVLASMDEVEETVQDQGSRPSHKDKEKEDLPSTSIAPDRLSSSVQGESTQASRKGKKKRKGRKKEVVPSSEPAEETVQSRDDE
ncbi:MAG: hypothetical protein LQ350_004331 [Teloschistes chrysophthalmus]|nr:MAG: hypothetical protein LQ350_004331 [Niorma chrysophthalma]